jgi:hypothetical protein
MKKLLYLLPLLVISLGAMAQKTESQPKPSAADSLMNAMNSTAGKKPNDIVPIFKSTRVVMVQSTETVKKNNLNFLVLHRFGDIGGAEGGGETLWGLDNSSDIYIGFEYGLTDNLDIDFGRSKFNQMIDLALKYAILHQKEDDSSPLAITVVGKTGFRPYKDESGIFDPYTNRFSYSLQGMLARRFAPWFSFQLTPTLIRNNSPIPFLEGSEKNFFALGAAARVRVTRRMSILLDYSHPFSSFRENSVDPKFYDPLGIGLEIETGGHVFTINFTNAKAINEINYLSDTESSWGKGQFRLGFTISRMFDLNPKHKNPYK